MFGSSLHGAYNIADLKIRARRRLPRGIYDFVERGTEDELGLARNLRAFERTTLVPRVLRDVSVVDPATTILDGPAAMPLIVGPTGAAGTVSFNGDLALARAAGAARVPFVISSAATMPIEQIMAAGGRIWFQLYLWENRELTYKVVDRAQELGCEALFVTVDSPVSPNREYNQRNGFAAPFRVGVRNFIDIATHPVWLVDVILRYMLNGGLPVAANLPPELASKVTAIPMPGARFRMHDLTWDEFRTIRKRWKGKLLLKGVARPEDAAQAVALGADGVVVSNHGGRNMDPSPASLDLLPPIVDAIGAKATVLVDGGVRRGSDVMKALALGAKAVLIGRPTLYGLAVGGEAGAATALEILRSEFVRMMAMMGSRNVTEITADLLGPRDA